MDDAQDGLMDDAQDGLMDDVRDDLMDFHKDVHMDERMELPNLDKVVIHQDDHRKGQGIGD